jgi:hypothetical protein
VGSENMAIVSVDYDEDKPEIYRGVVFEHDNGEEKRVNTGDFIDDFNAMREYLITKYPGLYIPCSSSVGHYINDANIDLIWEE